MSRLLIATTLLVSFFCHAVKLYAQQKNNTPAYPSLLWEITGNGLKKPSYLFGTMHVSSKLAFHLSDSFYTAIQSVDAVALELNPELWQGQMASLDKLKYNYAVYAQPAGNNYLTQHSFAVNTYDDALKSALSTAPSIVNGLLYRSYKAKEDFEEDTFLDLYIFQTGKKLGKRATGVEDYYETEKIMLQAYADMANDKNKKRLDDDAEPVRDIMEKIQDAYKRGDLDMMDSLDKLTNQSAAFMEKFMFLRNQIQAASIDTIVKKSSLFVGVGAAHLPGPRGVIELLRKMGYRLRPVKMHNRDAVKKETIDNATVPVTFSNRKSADGFYTVDVPGPLFEWKEEYNNLDRRQYADMANGSYYQVTRLRTHAAFLYQPLQAVRKKIDSLLYENIPGKILKKTAISKNGYPGYDITNKTRRGDIQRCHIYITPAEILIFKISGKENYANGMEANRFLSSITLQQLPATPLLYRPAQGGFAVSLPHTPTAYLNTNTSDDMNRWEYEAQDTTTGNAYLVFKKSVYNFKFLEEDSFDIKLVEESFRSPDFFEYQLQRTPGICQGYPCLDVIEKMKDSSIVTARYIIQGPHYYAIAIRSKDTGSNARQFIQSFKLLPYQYSHTTNYTDSFLHFSANTPVWPIVDTAYRAAAEKAAKEVNNASNFTYWPRKRFATFNSDSTGEMIALSIQAYPTYYMPRDSAKFWTNEIEEHYDKTDLLLTNKQFFTRPDSSMGCSFVLADTGSSRRIHKLLLLKNNYLYSLVSLTDTLTSPSPFTSNFFSSFAAAPPASAPIFKSKLDTFFTHLFSTDSLTRTHARKVISNLYFGEQGAAILVAAINKLSPADKDYIEVKTKLIAELGYIKDTTQPFIANYLQQLYKQVADTSLFQNEILEALARHKTTRAAAIFKELILQDPPVYDNEYAYQSLFEHFEDTLLLAATLYPQILQLASVPDYQKHVTGLLVQLVDSGLVKGNQYSSYYSKLYFDARLELKKQQAKEEKKTDAYKRNDDSNEDGYAMPPDAAYNYSGNQRSKPLKDCAILLAPFYNSNEAVPRFFNKLLQSKDNDLKLAALTTLLKNKLPIPDSTLLLLAANDQQRGKLYQQLEAIQQLNRFPAFYKTQLDLAKSYLLQDKNYATIDSVEYISRQTAVHNHRSGMVYFFKYRVKKTDDWKIGISGLQPINPATVSSNTVLVNMTDKKLKPGEPQQQQLQQQLKYTLFSLHNSARYFFNHNGQQPYPYQVNE
jgi:uncharacterized protein YbaP (TraB family)